MLRLRKRDILALLLILILVVVFVYSGVHLLGSVMNKEEQDTQPAKRKTVTYDGVDYFPRQDIDVFLLMGIDKEGPVQPSNSYNNDGTADTVLLLIFDQTAEEICVLNLNRDSMVQMPVLGVGGNPAGTFFGQLALAHSYGTGMEDSCENVRQTVSDLLMGIAIDHYVAVNMDAVALANDAVGGVTVTVTDDFSLVDENLPMGEVTLHGQQAINFVRLRRDVGDQLNVSRMKRQEVYMEGFLTALKNKLEQGESFALSLYDSVSPYMVTDCSANTFSEVLDDYGDYLLTDIITPEGENVRGEEYMEYHLNEEALETLILQLFYAPKK